ncbi:hypothetical protein [Thalassomonas haliotis]|uniref:Uncharacterized protein n=1 Tax=Thalassomonas haliotis TaxID=485448 RepID=A0ABY7VCH8_9GAMM|nr:hypothetical protein [Thalassomonas haliotis]WDE11263.1 hypothetical protein H3N35_24075 [Thalassomonas haliotis]
MMKKIALILAAVMVLFVSVLLLDLGAGSKEKNGESTRVTKAGIGGSKAEPKRKEQQAANIASLQEQVLPQQAKEIGKSAPVSQKEQISSDDYLNELAFKPSLKAEQVLKASGKLRDNLQGEVYLEINNVEISSLEAGDSFKLEIPELGMFYEIAVDKTHQDKFGNKTIEAVLPDQEAKYSSIITISEHAIYANITTPYGSYAMEGNGQYAWMAETADLIHDVIQDSFVTGATAGGDTHTAPAGTGNGMR